MAREIKLTFKGGKMTSEGLGYDGSQDCEAHLDAIKKALQNRGVTSELEEFKSKSEYDEKVPAQRVGTGR